MYSKNSMSPKIITSEIKRYRKDDFAEVRAEIAVRLRDRVSKILRWLAKRTSNLLSGKISKWLLECADDVAASRIEKAKVKLSRAVLFVKQNKAVLGAAAIALVSTITPIVVMLKNKQLLKEKMSSALTKAIQKGRLNYARNNKFETFKKIIVGSHKLGGVPELPFKKRQEKELYGEVQEDLNEDRLMVLKAIAIIKNPKSNESELSRAGKLINNATWSEKSMKHPKYTGAVGIITKKLFAKKLSSLNSLKENALDMLNKRRSLKDCLPSARRHNEVLEGVRDKISQMLRAIAKKCTGMFR